MSQSENDEKRPDFRTALERDSSRRERREPGHRSFWQSLGVIGMVGWPIAFCSVGGTLLGRYLDLHLGTGIHFTLILMTVGVALGCFVAWKTVRRV